ncbi:MAG: HAMP domain-containing histidine kinase [Pontiellaceae bacterium]|nr:HAMP domain-containing histidine kinase [Pontiellaceae bacterium]MBN2785491.1 HAMP domain-containing histidine kinase [Pontiellaceae bacterium]
MKSVRWTRLRKTFRFRLAILYMMMVMASLTITFMIALILVRASAVGFARTEMKVALHAAQTAYLGKQDEISDQLPEALLRRVEEQFPQIHIGLVEREVQPGGTLYEIIASTGSEWLEILADPAGDVWAADRKPVQEVYESMKESLGTDGRSAISLLLCDSEDHLLAGALSGEHPAENFELKVASDSVRMERRGEDLYGGLVLFDGNRLYAVKDMEEMEQITFWAFAFCAVLIVVFTPVSGWIGFMVSRKAMSGVQRVTVAAGRVQAGNFKARVDVSTEGTEIKELVYAFNAMVEQVDLLMRELRDVTANIAHDLKTPVMRIRGLIESSEWAEVGPTEREQMLASATEECDRLMPLIDSILELSRAEAGMLVLQEESFDLAAEVRSAHDMFSTVAEDHDILFRCSAPDGPVPMFGDRNRMQRVIANLLDNALKFAPQGGSVDLLLQTENDRIELIVRDNGPGIPENEVENVFKRFYRLDPSRNTPGHGLGLSMVRAFVNAFGGSVSIQSGAGSGCTVTVMLPLVAE